MLEEIYGAREDTRTEPESVTAFYTSFVHQEDEEYFYEAIRDAHYAGFKDGMKAALKLFADLQ